MKKDKKISSIEASIGRHNLNYDRILLGSAGILRCLSDAMGSLLDNPEMPEDQMKYWLEQYKHLLFTQKVFLRNLDYQLENMKELVNVNEEKYKQIEADFKQP